jgi:hypothetical protein
MPARQNAGFLLAVSVLSSGHDLVQQKKIETPKTILKINIIL